VIDNFVKSAILKSEILAKIHIIIQIAAYYNAFSCSGHKKIIINSFIIKYLLILWMYFA